MLDKRKYDILGDKLTAFAPHTTGVPLCVGKSMEIAKQLFDVATLIDVLERYKGCWYTHIVFYIGMNPAHTSKLRF